MAARPEDLVSHVPDGVLVALPPDYSLPSMALVHALIRRKSKNLRLLGVPVLGLSADLLIGAGCVAEVHSSAVSLGEAGLAPRFSEAAERGEIKVVDYTCPAVHTALQATEKGVPFMPLRGVIGSDLTRERSDWQVAQNPFSTAKDPILFVSAIVPDVALFHARWSDEAGNVWVGRRRELATIAHAARNTYVTVEEIRKGDMLEDEILAPGVISSVYISGISQAVRGAAPLGVADLYAIDDAHLALYAKRARSRDGFNEYLDEFVWQGRKNSLPA